MRITTEKRSSVLPEREVRITGKPKHCGDGKENANALVLHRCINGKDIKSFRDQPR
jgi:hypothetical protein